MSGRILIIYYSTHSVCGIGSWLDLLVPQLESRGWDVTVGLAWGAKFNDPARIERSRPGLKTVRMDGRTGTEEGRVQAITRAILEVNPDVVILNCLNSAFEAVRRVRHKLRNLRFVVTNHGNFPHQAAAILSHRDEIDLAVCIGRQSLPLMSTPPWGVSPERLIHLPNAVSGPDSLVPREPSDAFRVGYAGRLDSEDRKRIGDLVPFFTELSRRVANAEFWIAGDGDVKQKLEQDAAQFGPKIRFFGALTRQQLFRDFYPHLDVFVNFSTNEAFGLSMAEAMSHGVPVVTSEFFGLEDEKLILPGRNSLTFPIGDLKIAADQVCSLLANTELRTNLGRNGIHHINTSFSPEASGKAWTSALQECLARPAVNGPGKKSDRTSATRSWQSLKESLRRWTGRHFEHASAGEEWPHYVCDNAELLQKVVAIADRKQDSSQPMLMSQTWPREMQSGREQT
jgi:glycosyltransferase involved in cell wall biosynthesis